MGNNLDYIIKWLGNQLGGYGHPLILFITLLLDGHNPLKSF